jgi:uncharacterized membrane protein YhhN
MVLAPFYWAVAACFAVAYLLKIDQGSTLSRTLLKGVSVGTLALVTAFEGGPILLILALSFSALGDALLARRGELGIILGMCALAVGSLFLIVLFVNQEGLLGRDSMRMALQILAGVAFVVLLARQWSQLGELRAAAVAYGVLATGVCVFGLGLPPALWPASVGAGSIWASAALVALRPPRTSRSQFWRNSGVWLLYWCGLAATTAGILYPQH